MAWLSTDDSHETGRVFRASGARPRHTATAQIRRDIVKDVSQILPAPRSSPYRVYVIKYVRFSSSIARFTLLTTTCAGTCKINGEKLRIAWMPASTS